MGQEDKPVAHKNADLYKTPDGSHRHAKLSKLDCIGSHKCPDTQSK